MPSCVDQHCDVGLASARHSPSAVVSLRTDAVCGRRAVGGPAPVAARRRGWRFFTNVYVSPSYRCLLFYEPSPDESGRVASSSLPPAGDPSFSARRRGRRQQSAFPYDNQPAGM